MDNSMAKKGDPSVLMDLIRRIILEVNTSIPGEIVSFNPANQTATVQPCVRSVVINIKGEKRNLTLPIIASVPVMFPYSTTSGFSITYPVQKGDQCLIIFSQRCIDNWLAYGSVQDGVEPDRPRAHDLADAIAIVGLIPNPSAISSFQTDGVEIRNKDRKVHAKVTDTNVELISNDVSTHIKPDGVYINTKTVQADFLTSGDVLLTASGNIVATVTGNVDITSSANVSVKAAGQVTINAPNTNVVGNLNVSTGATGAIVGTNNVTATVVNGIVVKIS